MEEENKKTEAEVKNMAKKLQKGKVIKLVLFVLFLLILATGISSGVYFYLKNANERDSVSQITYLGILEDGTYYIPKARKDIRFQIDSLDANSYRLTNQNNEEVESIIVEENGKKLIQSKQYYTEGEIYTLELNDTNFTEEKLKNAKKLKFKIEEPEKAIYQFEDNVRIIENQADIQVQETEDAKTIKFSNSEIKKDEILLIKSQEKENSFSAAYKVVSVENGIATVTTPEVAEIYKEFDLYHEGKIDFSKIEINENFKEEIQLSIEKSPIYQFLVNESYAADNISTDVKVTPNNNELKIEMMIMAKASGDEFLGIKALANHNLTLKYIIDLSCDMIQDLKIDTGLNLDLALKQGFEFNIELETNQTILEGVEELSDEEYCKTIQDIIEKLESATEDKSKGKSRIAGIEVPTGITGVNVYFDVYFQTEFDLQISLTYNQRVEIVEHIGLIMNSQETIPYANVSSPKTDAELTVLGKAELRVGLGFDVGVSIISKDLAYIGIGPETGLYGEVFATMTTRYQSVNQHINENFVGKIEAGFYFKTKFSAGIDIFFLKKDFQKDLVEIKIPFIKLGTDEITSSIKATPDTLTIQNNAVSVPNITKVITNLSEGKDREEVCENVVFKDLNENTLSKVGNKINLGKNENTTIKAVYEENGRIYQTEIKIQKQGTQTSSNNTSNTNNSNKTTIGTNSNSSNNKNVIDAYRTYIRSKKYETYSRQWELGPEGYCIYDINQDGIEELLIVSQNNFGWRNTLVCSYANGSVIEIKDIYSYGELRYSVENKEIVYAEVKPYKDVGVHGFYQLRNNQFILTRSAGWDEEGKYFIRTSTSGIKRVSQEECNAQFNNLAYFRLSSLSNI